jgi:hypothetical protein
LDTILLYGIAIFAKMAQWLTAAQAEYLINFAISANARPFSFDVLATGDSAGAVKARNYLWFEKFAGHHFSQFLSIFLDTLAVFLDGAFPAYAFFCGFAIKRHFDSHCLCHLFPPSGMEVILF